MRLNWPATSWRIVVSILVLSGLSAHGAVTYNWVGADNDSWVDLSKWQDGGAANPPSLQPGDEYILDTADIAGADHNQDFGGATLKIDTGGLLRFKQNYGSGSATNAVIKLQGGALARESTTGGNLSGGSDTIAASCSLEIVAATTSEIRCLGNTNTHLYIAAPVSGSGTLNIAGNRDINFQDTASTFSGTVKINSGWITSKTTTLQNATVYANTGGMLSGISGQGTMTINALHLNGGSIANAGAGWTLYTTNIYVDMDSIIALSTTSGIGLAFNGALQGTGKLTQQGADETTFLKSASPLFSGGWLVEAGMLSVDVDEALGTGAVEVQATANQLKLLGNVDVTIAALTLAGEVVPGNATYTSQVDLENAGISSAAAALVNFGSGSTITIVPEPATLALLAIGGLGLAGGAIRRRRR